MKKHSWIMTILVAYFLAGCGGGGGSDTTGNTSVNNTTFPSISELDNAKATLSVQADRTTFTPATVREFVAHLSDGKQELFVEKKKIVKVFWNDGVVGWHSVDPKKGRELPYDPNNPVFVIMGQLISSFGGNFSFLLDDGRELAQNTDPKWLTITTGTGIFVERQADGLIYKVSTATPTPGTPKTLISINTITGQIDITPVIVGNKLANLVNTSPTETVLNTGNQVIAGYRIAWNDSGAWYPGGGKLTALLLPKTTLAGATKPVGTGAGMPYLVRPDGTFVPFNTNSETCTFVLNGALATVSSVDGLLHY